MYSIKNTHDISPVFSKDSGKFDPERWGAPFQSDTNNNHIPDLAIDQNNNCIMGDLRFDDVTSGDVTGAGAPPTLREAVSKNKQLFIPFGGGKRLCPGKDFARIVLRIVIAQLVTSFKWQVLNPDPPMRTSPIPFPSDGMPMKISKHNN